MNLVLDLGNTRAKAALFAGKNLVEAFNFDKNPLPQLKRLLNENPQIRFSIVSSVINHPKDIINLLHNKTNCVEFNHTTSLPLIIRYAAPETLGKDRLAAAMGGYALYPGKNLLVIDTGTCIKYNFITAIGEFLGGAISPGLNIRFKSLNAFTDRLPLLVPDFEKHEIIGNSSTGSIYSGVQNGALFEILGFINWYKSQYPELSIILTGGAMQHFAGELKSDIFAVQNLTLIGLNEILLFNTSKTT